MNFITTNQNPHIRIQHADIPDGTTFYIIIKGISGSNVEGLVVGIVSGIYYEVN